MSLSSLLVQREVATIRDVEEAVARQVLYCGDLVTNLLESSKVDEGKLSEALGDETGLRPAGPGLLTSAPEHVRAMLPRATAESRNIVPLAFSEDGEQLVIAVAEPLTPTEDEKLMFALGIPLIQRIAPIVRIREALARDYGVPLDVRSERLLRRLRGERVETTQPPVTARVPRVATVPPAASAAPPTLVNPKPGLVARPTLAHFPAPQGLELLGAPTSSSEPSPRVIDRHPGSPTPFPAPGSRSPRRRRAPLTFDAAKRELEYVEDRDALLDLFFDFTRQYFDYSALFVVHGDIAEGRDASGSGTPRDRVSTVGVPLDLPSVLSVAKERAVALVTIPSSDGIDAMVVKDLARRPNAEVIVVPLVVRRRTVALLYGDAHDSGVPIDNPSDVTIFALLVGQSFERLIVKKKKGGSDRALPRFVQVSTREGASDDRTQRALALSRAMQEVAPPPSTQDPRAVPGHLGSAHSSPRMAQAALLDSLARQTVPAPPPAGFFSEHPTEPRSPAAISVPPPAEAPTVVISDRGPPPEAVVRVHRPSGPPIPREDPVDPTSRPPEQVFLGPGREPSAPGQSLRPSAAGDSARNHSRPSAAGDLARNQPRPSAPIPREEPKTNPGMPAVPSPEEHERAPDALASPERSMPVDQGDGDLAVSAGSGPPPARIDAEELPAHVARELLAEIDGEEIDDDMIQESAPVSVIPPSQTVVVAPHRPPTSRTDTENLPTIIVDVSAELEVLVRDIAAGKNEERAEEELLRQGAAAMPAILASFPGPTRNEPTADQDVFPPFSSCGPVLRLIAAQRKVALPYVLPLVGDDREDRRFWATFAISELAYPEAMPVLVTRLFDASARIRRAAGLAIAAISRVHGEHVARELGRFARDSQNDRKRRLGVMQLLEEVREPMAVPTFVAMVEDPDRELGEMALHALETITRQEFGGDLKKWKSWWNSHSSHHRIEWLIDALMHESLKVRRDASEELKGITKEYFGYYPDESKRDRERAQSRYAEWWQNEGRLKFVVG